MDMTFEKVVWFVRGGQNSPDQDRLNRMNARVRHMEEKEAAHTAEKKEAADRDAAVIAQNIERVEKVTQNLKDTAEEMKPREDTQRAEAA